jgi:hypothetical protein
VAYCCCGKGGEGALYAYVGLMSYNPSSPRKSSSAFVYFNFDQYYVNLYTYYVFKKYSDLVVVLGGRV